MKKHLRLPRGSEAGCSRLGPFYKSIPRSHQQRNWNAKIWLALGGSALLVLLLTQGWLIADSTAPAQHDKDTASSSNHASTGLHAPQLRPIDVGHVALLDTLWGALPFTRVIKHHEGFSSLSFWHHPTRSVQQQRVSTPHTPQQQQQQQQQQPASGAAAKGALLDAATRNHPTLSSSSSSRGDTRPAQQNTPQLYSPSHPELTLLHRLATAALQSGMTGDEAREAYVAAFQAVPPPKGWPAWQVKLPPNPEAAAAAEAAQQQQHKGAQFISIDEAEADAGFNLTAYDLLKTRPKGRTLTDEAALAAAATEYLAGVDTHGQRQQQQGQAGARTSAQQAAQHLMHYALLLIKATHKLAPCATDDASLPIDKLMGTPHAPRVLLAVTGVSKGSEGLPNMVLQLLQVVLQSQPGSLYISLVEDSAGSSSGSSSDSSNNGSSGSSSIDSSSADSGSDSSSEDAAYLINILQLLLAPLQTPVLVAHTSSPQGGLGSSNDEHNMKTRNLAIEPFFGSKADAHCSAETFSTADQDTEQAELLGHKDASTSSSSSSSDSSVLGLVQDTQHLLQHETVGKDDESGVLGSSSSGRERRRLLQQRRQGVARALKSRGSFGFDSMAATTSAVDAAAAAAAGAQSQEGKAGNAQLDAPPTAAAVAAGSAAMAQGQTAATSAAGKPQEAEASEHAASNPSGVRNDPTSRPECFNPDWVVFIQASSLFCKSDLQRVLMHTDADMTCGMDMHVAEPSPDSKSAEQAAATAAAAAASAEDETSAPVTAEMLRRQLLSQQQQQRHTSQVDVTLDGSMQPASTGVESTSIAHAAPQPAAEAAVAGLAAAAAAAGSAAGTAAAEAWHERPPALDVWKHPLVYAGAGIGRMINGQPFSAAPFYANAHAPTLRRLVAGLPVQVYCCWSGLTKLSAKPFQQGLRFRAQAEPGECSSGSSGLGLLCDDLHRTGFNKVLMDAGVLLTHDLDVSVKCTPLIKAAERAPYIRRSRWVEVQGSGTPWELHGSNSWQQTYKEIQCCQGPEQQQQQSLVVDEMVQAVEASSRPGPPLPLRGWDVSGCTPVDIIAKNHTKTALERSGVALS